MEKEKNNLQELLANNLIYYRKASGLTQLELAQRFNYSDKSVSKWERGEGFPDVFVLKSLADFYGISIDDFYASEHKSIKIRDRQKHKQVYLQLFSVGLVWVVITAIYMILKVLVGDEAVFKPWLIFIYGTVATFIVLIVWHSIFHLRFLRLFSVSLTIWSVAAAIFVSFYVMMSLNLYLVFFVAIPLEVLEVLWYLFRRKSHRKEIK